MDCRESAGVHFLLLATSLKKIGKIIKIIKPNGVYYHNNEHFIPPVKFFL